MAMKVCSKCGQNKPIDDYYNTSSGRGYYGKRADCKTCTNAASVIRVAEWRRNNPDKRKAVDARYRRNNREKCRAASRKSYRKKPAKYKARTRAWANRHPDKVREYDRNFKARNRTLLAMRSSKRRAQKVRAGGEFTKDEWLMLCQDTGYRCVYCGVVDAKLHADHVVPLSRGGRHDISNIVPACARCNCSKGAKPLVLWLAQGGAL